MEETFLKKILQTSFKKLVFYVKDCSKQNKFNALRNMSN